LGYLALGIESTLPIPQFISNARRHTCVGLSDLTVLFWLLGDVFKTAYFFLRGSPWQFCITAVLTVMWDVGESSGRRSVVQGDRADLLDG
jgi:hypothetical protein